MIDTRESRIAPFLAQGGNVHDRVRDNIDAHEIFSAGRIHMETDRLHTVGPLSVDIPRGRLTAVTGVSGSGKTTMVLEMLMPALQSRIDRSPQPTQVRPRGGRCVQGTSYRCHAYRREHTFHRRYILRRP